MTTQRSALRSITSVQQRQFSELYDFYMTGELVDATVEVRGVQIRLHKTVLAVRSPVFRAMFQSGMRETRTSHIIIPDVEPATFEQIVFYLYNGFCPNLRTHHLEILKFADKYDLVELVKECEAMSSACWNVNNAVEYLILADMLCKDTMKNGVLDFMKTRIRSIIQKDGWRDLSFQLKTALALKYPRENVSLIEALRSYSVLETEPNTIIWLVDSDSFAAADPVTSPRFQLEINGELVCFCFTFCLYNEPQSPIQITLLSKSATFPLSIRGKFVLHGVRSHYLSVDKTVTWTLADIDAPQHVVPRRKNILYVNSNFHQELHFLPGFVKFSFTVADLSTSCVKSNPIDRDHLLRLQPYLNSGRYSDVTFRVDGQTFYGHRLVLAALCPAFDRMFGMPGSVFELTNVTADDFHIALRYLYSNELPDPKDVKGSTLKTAQILELEALFDHCERALLRYIRAESAVKTLITSHQLGACLLKDRAKLFIKRNMLTVTDTKSWNKLEEHPDLFNELLFDLASTCPLIPDNFNLP